MMCCEYTLRVSLGSKCVIDPSLAGACCIVTQFKSVAWAQKLVWCPIQEVIPRLTNGNENQGTPCRVDVSHRLSLPRAIHTLAIFGGDCWLRFICPSSILKR